MANTNQWTRAFGGWLRRSRLFMASHEPLLKLLWGAWKSRQYLAAGNENLKKIFEQEFPDRPCPL